MAAACLYKINRDKQLARTLSDFALATKIRKKDIGRSYRALQRNLESSAPVGDVKYFISRYVNLLGLSGQTQSIASQIDDLAKTKKLASGRSPQARAAAYIYQACEIARLENNRERRTQREIAETVNVTEVTIRNRYTELQEVLFSEISALESKFKNTK